MSSFSESIFNLLVFSLLANAMTGLLLAVPGFEQFGGGGFSFNQDYDDSWRGGTEGINNTIPLAGDKVSDTGASNTVQDFARVKIATKILRIGDQLIFGFINLMSSAFKGYLNSAGTNLGTMFFNSLKAIIVFGYIIYAARAISNKRLEGK